MSKGKILLVGGGGHCRSVIDVINETTQYEEVAIVDAIDKVGSILQGCQVIGSDDDLPRLISLGYRYAFVALGSVGISKRREELYQLLSKLGFEIPNIISRTALVSDSAHIGKGNFIGKGVIINTGVNLGNNAILNTGSIIEHDCKIGNSVHISPGAVLSGQVNIESGSHIGTNSTIIQGVRVGENTLIGAGSVVVKNIPSGVVAFGVPCRERK
jgi:sugar O-acyltransferase (sialic acid O-acetyltransferase NeuD family)